MKSVSNIPVNATVNARNVRLLHLHTQTLSEVSDRLADFVSSQIFVSADFSSWMSFG